MRSMLEKHGNTIGGVAIGYALIAVIVLLMTCTSMILPVILAAKARRRSGRNKEKEDDRTAASLMREQFGRSEGAVQLCHFWSSP